VGEVLGARRGRRPRDGLLPLSSPLRRMARPTATAFAAGRAILMELAHPAVAHAVADFDHFREDPARRAQLTAKAFRDVIHGSEEEAAAVGRRLRAVHRRVNGPGYAAADPALLLWVHATFVDSLLVVGERVYGPLSTAARAEFYRHAVVVGEVFGCPAELQPATIDDFDRYVEDMVGSLEVTDVGRQLARAVFWPPVPANRGPIISLYRLASFGMLPARLRDQFGYPWQRSRERVLHGGKHLAPVVAPVADRLFFAIADSNGRGMSAALALAGIRPGSPPSR
jgi:uncharacterized protein (DUF2236 family)